MRIGIDARFYGGEQSKGLGRYTQKLIEGLAAIDQVNDYVIFLQAEEFRKWDIKNLRFKPVLAPYRWYSIKEQLFMPALIYRHKVDLMHFPHFNLPLLYYGRFVVTIHDLVISHFPTQRATTLAPWLYTIKQLAYKLVIRQAAQRAEKIITISQYSKKDIIDYFKISSDKIIITYEGAGGETAASARPEILSRYQIKPPYLLYVGNAYPHKNLEVLLKVAQKLKSEKQLNWQMVFVGKEDYFYTRLKQRAWLLDVQDKICFTGFIPDRHLTDIYAGALAYIFPSKYEGFGLPPLEAMAHGVPVLAARASCLPEILESAALYFDPDDVYGIIKQLILLNSDPAVREKIINAGKKQIKKYSWLKMAQETYQIYLQVCQK